jgi:hypothetical protein
MVGTLFRCDEPADIKYISVSYGFHLTRTSPKHIFVVAESFALEEWRDLGHLHHDKIEIEFFGTKGKLFFPKQVNNLFIEPSHHVKTPTILREH